MRVRVKAILVAGALLCSLAAVSCSSSPGQSGSSTSKSGSSSPERGGNLVFAEVGGGEWNTMDPLESDTRGGPIAYMYESFFGYQYDASSKSWKLTPLLATGYSAKNPLKPVFTLRQGVKFQDGSSWNASVAAWNINRMRTDKAGTGVGPLADVESVQVLSPYQVQITLKQPDSGLDLAFSPASGAVFNLMVSEQAFTKDGAKAFDQHGSGTGPWEFKSFVSDGQDVLQRNPNYWQKASNGQSLPYISTLTFTPVSDEQAAYAQLQSGAITLYSPTLISNFNAAKSVPDLKQLVFPGVGIFPNVHAFNLKSGPFVTAQARIAAEEALNRTVIANAIAPKVGVPWEEPDFASGTSVYQAGLNSSYPYDPSKAKAALAAAGDSGAKVDIIYQSRQPDATVAQLMQQMWDAVGLKVTLSPLDPSVFGVRLEKQQYTVALYADATITTGSSLATKYLPGGLQDYNQYNSPRVASLLAQADAATSDSAAVALYKEVMDQVMKDTPIGVLVLEPYPYLSRSNLHNVTFNSQIPDLTNAWLSGS
jgi:peptide/nickel transport system substrate-binding protein